MSEKPRRRRAVIRRDGEVCAECGTTENLTIDHIVPRSKGGSNALVNLRLLCLPCNHAKGNRLDPADITPARMGRAKEQIKARLRSGSRAATSGLHRGKGGRMLIHDSRCDAQFCINTCPVYLDRGVYL